MLSLANRGFQKCSILVRVVHKLRNTDGVDGWSEKVLLRQSLVWYAINKMKAKIYYRGGSKIVKSVLRNL